MAQLGVGGKLWLYVSAHILLNLLNELGKKIRCDALLSILLVCTSKFNKFNNTGARIQDSIYHMTLKSHLFVFFATKRQDSVIGKCNDVMNVIA